MKASTKLSSKGQIVLPKEIRDRQGSPRGQSRVAKAGQDPQMIAVDTHIIVRALTNDEPAQAARAMALMRASRVFVPKTVLLEAAWVMASTHKLDRATIHRALSMLAAAETVELEDRAQALSALDWYAAGMDFADALHLAASAPATQFATFDRGLVRAAERLETIPTVIEP